MDVWSTWIEQSLASPWLYALLLALVIADAFLVILPSETLVVALGSLALSTGTPHLGLVIATATAGAIIGDNACYWIGRSVPIDRIRWLQRPGPARAFTRARSAIGARPASLILTARYIPFARIAVNLTAGATGFRYGRYLPLTAVAGASWAVYNVAVGALFGAWLGENPVLAVVVSVVVAVALGMTIDRISARLSVRRRGYSPTLNVMDANDSPKTDPEETKRKFREALERKKNGNQAHPGNVEGESAVNGTHDKAGGKREFRRKTG